jgi:hypothetical protein
LLEALDDIENKFQGITVDDIMEAYNSGEEVGFPNVGWVSGFDFTNFYSPG